ncbi:MAG TPA: VIT family protein [Kofleriaceae bacterium]|nr:VIT family protein [Kofleriaceae bacterium]
MAEPARTQSARHGERHRSERGGWLRAAVLGSNDAIVSTSGLLLGVSATSASGHTIAVVGFAGLVAGSMSMAVGEYVSVSSQRDAEKADIALESRELATDPAAELAELTAIYQQRGLDAALAAQVAAQLTAHNPLAAHLRDELNLEPTSRARPLQAALVSAASFAAFAILPILALLAAPAGARIFVVAGFTLALLAVLGALGAYLGGASPYRAVLRVTLGGALAMAATVGIGRLIGT